MSKVKNLSTCLSRTVEGEDRKPKQMKSELKMDCYSRCPWNSQEHHWDFIEEPYFSSLEYLQEMEKFMNTNGPKKLILEVVHFWVDW